MINRLFSLFFLVVFVAGASAEYLIIDTTSGDLTVLNVFSIPDLINYARQQQENEANQNIWPTITPNTNDVACSGTVSAQYTPSTGTYSIPQWYYHTFHGLVAVSISVTDLQAFARAAVDSGIWRNVYDCQDVWDRINNDFIVPLLASATFKTTMQVENPMVGLSIAMMCGEVICTPNQLQETLKTAPLPAQNERVDVQIV